MDETIHTQEAEVKAPEASTTETTVEQPEVQQTVGEIIEQSQPEKKPELEYDKAYFSEKKARKAAERELNNLKKQIEGGATKKEISESIAEIADEHNIDPEFLQKLATSIKAEAEKDIDAKYAAKFEGKERENKFETAFKSQYEIAMERAPEFKAIANPEVIKALAILPQNAKKTLSEILEETYGNAITGKRTIETTSPGGGKEPEPLDIRRAEKDIEYFKEVMSDPKKKAQYNEAMLKRGF